MAKEDLTRAERIAMRMSMAQTILAVIGFVVGAIALYAALDEADAVRKQQQASVWPFVEVTLSNNNVEGDEFIAIGVENKGIGPARIRNVAVFLDDKPRSDWWDLIKTSAALGEQPLYLTNEDLYGKVVAAGEEILLVRMDKSSVEPQDGEVDHHELLRRFRTVFGEGRFRMEACYCSVFDDCWLLNTDKYGEPERVAACAPQAEGVSF